MTSVASPFSVFVEDQILTVVHLNESVRRTLCVVRIEPPYSLQAMGRHITITTSIKNYGHHLEILSPDGTDPGELLTLIQSALRVDQQARHARKRRLKAIMLTIGIASTMLCGAFYVAGHVPAFSTTENKPSYPSPLYEAQHPANGVVDAVSQRAIPAIAQIPVQPRQDSSSGVVATDNWPLPASIRAGLPEKLRRAADRQLFTIPYSSGHARTLYVFADPACPNCQRLEPALNAAAGEYNVVVFPVAVIGKEKSIASVAPVLCLPFEQRKAAWDALFDKTGDVMNLGKAKPAAKDAGEPDDCDVAHQALGVNEVAYQTYRIPGTPWVIADDGRYVSQAVLQDPAFLNAFMQTQEVIDAGQ